MSTYSAYSNVAYVNVAVTVNLDTNLYLATSTVKVWRPLDPDASPLVTFTTVLDQQ